MVVKGLGTSFIMGASRMTRPRCEPIKAQRILGATQPHLRGKIELSGREIGFPDLDSVGMKRPVAKRLGFAEFLLCQFGGLALG